MLTIEQGPDNVIMISGRLDATQTDKAKEFFAGVTKSATLDCTGLEYISSAGLGTLLLIQQRLRAQGEGLKLIHLNEMINTIFRHAHFHEFFEIG